MLFKYLLGNIFYFISYVIPKSKNIWIFGSWGGKNFSDNPKYFYNYIKINHTNITPVWLSVNRELIKELKNKGHYIYHTYSVLGIWYSSRALVGIVSHGLVDINRFACARMNIVQTWHGIPMKPVLLSDPKIQAKVKRSKLLNLRYIFPFLRKELLYDRNLIICSTSMHVEHLLGKVFGANAPLYNVGFPRLDGLFNPSKDNSIFKEIDNHKKDGKQVGVYMPTYRREGEFDIIAYLMQNKIEIEETLLINNSIIYLKIHPYDYFKIKDKFQSKTIRLIEDKLIDSDIYKILGSFDFLISDYSSVVFDFLILNKPVYLLVPDRKEYISSNGKFIYDYVNIGIPEGNTWSKMLDLISNKKTITNLNTISIKYHQNRDCKNSERLFLAIKSKLNK
jgi:CDP-glycerol glycerophosphotransferase